MPCPIPESSLPQTVRKHVSKGANVRQRLMAAQGLIPLRPPDMVLSLFCLLYDPDEKVRLSALQTLRKLPVNIMKPAVSAKLPAAVLDYLSRGLLDKADILKAVVINANTSDETIEKLARITNGDVLDIIARNQQRILRKPAIAWAVLENPNTSIALAEGVKEFLARSGIDLGPAAPEPEKTTEQVDTSEPEQAMEEEIEGAEEAWDQEEPDLGAGPLRQRSLLEETEEGGFEDEDDEYGGDLQFEVRGGAAVETVGEVKVRQRTMLDESIEDEDEEGQGSGQERILEFPSYMIDETGDWDDEEREGLETMLSKMSPAEKIKLATMGNKTIRTALVKDTNKLVALAAASSPKITEGEMVNIAASRAVTDDVIRYASNNRDYLKLYQVKCNLVMNPKTPTGSALRLLNHLRENDLRQVANSKNIPNVVATAAKKKLKLRRSGK
ncbi:MAG: hypothetical protein GXP49_17020 [Deltaproteobacteria bacterium]|nr:hypothetical protein [Deltaproteobacteria bacterium]